VRVRSLSSAVAFSLTIVAAWASPAFANGPGGAVAGSTKSTHTTKKKSTRKSTRKNTTLTPDNGGVSAAPPVVPPGASPITARTPNLAYSGPVYQRTATGAVVPYEPPAPVGTVSAATGGSPVATGASEKPQLLVPGTLARYVNGLAAAPMSAPAAVQEIIWAGDQIIGLPYIFGGGHASFISPGYDCSGTVSFALHGANLLAAPEDSSEFEVWGSHGVGRWVTVFANPGHAYMDVAGLRLDTSAADDPSDQQGPRWRPLRPANGGYVVRHPLGL
jgi:cell wall-associated NlpC family hydrolase